MLDASPYSPSGGPLEEAPGIDPPVLDLAERGPRIKAALIDFLILLVPAALLGWGIRLVLGLLPLPGGWILGTLAGVGGAAATALVFLLVNRRLLEDSGQTYGKRYCRIRIVKPDGSVPGLGDSFFRRMAMVSLAGSVPYVGFLVPLADVALFFIRKDRRCLHDDLAGTVVVKVP